MKAFEDCNLANIFLKYKFAQISCVFTIPQRKWLQTNQIVFENFYPISFIHLKKVFYLRSYGVNFCITPIDFIRDKNTAVFSYGKGLYHERELEVLLAEASSNKEEIIANLALDLDDELSKVSNIIYEMKKNERFGKYWLNISVMMQ